MNVLGHQFLPSFPIFHCWYLSVFDSEASQQTLQVCVPAAPSRSSPRSLCWVPSLAQLVNKLIPPITYRQSRAGQGAASPGSSVNQVTDITPINCDVTSVQVLQNISMTEHIHIQCPEDGNYCSSHIKGKSKK